MGWMTLAKHFLPPLKRRSLIMLGRWLITCLRPTTTLTELSLTWGLLHWHWLPIRPAKVELLASVPLLGSLVSPTTKYIKFLWSRITY
jgi:hypothetical protein